MPTLRRLFSAEPLAGTGASVRLDPAECHHALHVLRLRRGDRVLVFDAGGSQFAAAVEQADKKHLTVLLNEVVPAAPETPLPISLYLALTKAAAFENVLQRAVELGAGEIVPFAAERSVPLVGRGNDAEAKLERWRLILLAATKQCGRARLTAIPPPFSFEEAIHRPGEATLRFCGAPHADAHDLSEMLHALKPAAAPSLALMIGPEGGLTVGETSAARRAGWHLVSLGPRTLRVETAATAALALLLASLGEL